MAVCTHCGRESQGQERYCLSCGQPLTTDEAPVGAGVGAPVQQVALAAQMPQMSPQMQQMPQGAQDFAQPAAQSAVPITDGSQGEAGTPSIPQSRLIVRRLASADGGSADGPSIEVGEFILDGRDVAVGRAPSCDIVLEGDQLASRRHALLRSRSDGYTVVDLGSSNGTYINDLEIREAALLHEGDRISIGGHELIYSTTPPSPTASLAGVKLAPLDGTPATDTDPNAEAVSTSETAESPAILLASAEPEAVVMSDASDLEAAAANDEAARLDEAAPPAEEQEEQAVPQRQTDFAASGVTDADFEALQLQLAQLSDALARKASTESRVVSRLRNALEMARDQLAALASDTASRTPSSDVSDLVYIARQAAENPRHLDYLTALSEHASEIAEALQASASGNGISAAELDALRAKLDEALG